MTDAEQALWRQLRRKRVHGIQFYRQRPLGSFIADFYAPAAGLIIEIDGAQHFTGNGRKYDRARTRFLESQGLAVLRFDNRQVLAETEAVVELIYSVVVARVGRGGNPS